MLLRRVYIAAALVILGSTTGALLKLNKVTPFIKSDRLSSQLFVSSAVAQTPTNQDQKQPRQQGWLKNLNLTSEQLKQIQTIRKQSKGNINLKKQAIQQAKQEFEALMADTTPASEVRKKYNQLKTLRQELSDIQLENTLAIREVLNPEQRQKYADHMYKKTNPNPKPN
jgi:periplasmic protein CpxP/Spy